MDIEREQRIRARAYQYWLDEGNPDEWYNWFRATQDVDAEDVTTDDNLIEQLEAALSTAGPETSGTSTITTRSGREVPAALMSEGMLSVSNRAIMRLILSNNSELAALFQAYARTQGDNPDMTFDEFLKLSKDFNITPKLCNEAQLSELFRMVNEGEAGDEDTEALDSEEFNECLVRLGVFYGPTTTPLTRENGVSEAVAGLLSHMNKSGAAAKLATDRPIVFHLKKTSSFRK